MVEKMYETPALEEIRIKIDDVIMSSPVDGEEPVKDTDIFN